MTDSTEREPMTFTCQQLAACEGWCGPGKCPMWCGLGRCQPVFARAAAPHAQPSEQWAADLLGVPVYKLVKAAKVSTQAQPAPAGQPFVPLSMPELLRRVERARQFPVNTCPASRNVHLMACALAIRQPYAMLTDEPQHCAESMLYVLASLWEARTEIERLARSPEPAPISDRRIIEIRDSLLPSQGESFDCIAFARVVLAERMAPK